MKLQNIVFALSLSITATAGLYQGDGDKKAEDVYKNIKTLKGMPANEVIPSMKFMSASLKVDCEYCHKEDDFASDAKEEKEAARHMIEMQRDINEKNFRGRTEVTCSTCHNGSTHPQSSVPSLESVSRRTIDRGAESAIPADVLKKYQTAVGGDLKAVEFDGTVSGFGPEGPAKVTQGGAKNFVMEFGGRKFGFDGSVTWMQAGGQSQPLPADHAVEFQNFGRFYRGASAFEVFGELRFAGRDKIDGKEVVVLRTAARGAKSSSDLYFDAKTGLLSRIASYTATPLGSIPESTDFSDYRKVGEAMVPFKITRSGGKEPVVFKFEKATANPKLDDKFFSMPPK